LPFPRSRRRRPGLGAEVKWVPMLLEGDPGAALSARVPAPPHLLGCGRRPRSPTRDGDAATPNQRPMVRGVTSASARTARTSLSN
jgi:hypothetical protein